MRIPLIIVVTFCMMSLAVAQSQDWEQLGGPKGAYQFSMLQSASGSVVAWQSDGGFVRSTDGGLSWERNMRERNQGYKQHPVSRICMRDDVLYTEKFPWTSMYRSTDDGLSWDSIPAPEGAQLLTVTPEHEIIVLVGEELQASSDTGTSWRSINLSTSAWVDGTVLALGVEDGGWFVNLQNQGLFRSTDRGVSWERIVEGITDSRNEALVLIDDDRLFSCMHDQLRLSTDGGETWEDCIGAVDRIRGIVRRDHYYLIAHSWNAIYRSTDQGFSWATMTTPEMEWIYQILALDDGTLLAHADNRLLRSTDAGLSWTESMDGLYYAGSTPMLDTRSDHLLFSYRTLRATNDYGGTWRRAEAPDKSGLAGPFLFAGDGSMYAFSLMGERSCRVYRSTDDGMRWSIRSIIPTSIGLISPAREGMAETSEGFLFADSDGILLRSTDAGATWNPFGDLATAMSTTAGSLRKLLALSPPHADIVFSAHWNGLFRSTNGGEHWDALVPAGGTTSSRDDSCRGRRRIAALRHQRTHAADAFSRTIGSRGS
jgi:photosystem II stability/assembly factor-like uncharacterized protein